MGQKLTDCDQWPVAVSRWALKCWLGAKAPLGSQSMNFMGRPSVTWLPPPAVHCSMRRPAVLENPAPGHEIAVLDARGQPSDVEGDIAVRRGSAAMMLEYWNRPDATQEKYRGDWMLTGDRGIWTGEFLRFIGREDDVITSAG